MPDPARARRPRCGRRVPAPLLLAGLGFVAVLRNPPASLLVLPPVRRAALGLLLPLALSKPEPASAGDLGAQIAEGSGLSALLGLDTAEAKLFSADLYAADGARVKIRFSTPWPVKRDMDGGFRAGFESRKSNQYQGEAAFTQVVKKIGVDSVEGLTTKQIIDAVFTGPRIGENNFTPENVKQAGKVKTVAGPEGAPYKLVGARFTRVGASGVEVESHALISATVAAGDLFLLVATCRESTWANSQKRMQPVVESFQALPASSR